MLDAVPSDLRPWILRPVLCWSTSGCRDHAPAGGRRLRLCRPRRAAGDRADEQARIVALGIPGSYADVWIVRCRTATCRPQPAIRSGANAIAIIGWRDWARRGRADRLLPVGRGWLLRARIDRDPERRTDDGAMRSPRAALLDCRPACADAATPQRRPGAASCCCGLRAEGAGSTRLRAPAVARPLSRGGGWAGSALGALADGLDRLDGRLRGRRRNRGPARGQGDGRAAARSLARRRRRPGSRMSIPGSGARRSRPPSGVRASRCRAGRGSGALAARGAALSGISRTGQPAAIEAGPNASPACAAGRLAPPARPLAQGHRATAAPARS